MYFDKTGRFSSNREIALFAVAFLLVVLVGFAVAGRANGLFFAIVASAGIAAVLVRRLFPFGRFLALTLVSLIAVYAAVFAFFVEELFGRIRPGVSGLGFSLPILAFLLGCWVWRDDVSAVLDLPEIENSQALFRALFWLVPVFSVGVLALTVSAFAEGAMNTDLAFLGTMLVIALVVLMVSRNVATFLVDAGLLLEEFFRRMSRLAVPAFAFLTCYALLVIIFACFYALISQHSAQSHFRLGGDARAIGFSEALHFSIVTLSTVGYGDIVPTSNVTRALASVEVICGVLLLLFGVSELQEYAREHRHDRGARQKVLDRSH